MRLIAVTQKLAHLQIYILRVLRLLWWVWLLKRSAFKKNSSHENGTLPTRSLSLEQKLRELKDARLYKVCLAEEVAVTFIPCGHLDLRKLIKYEENLGIHLGHGNYFDSLHKHTTTSSRAKLCAEKEQLNSLAHFSKHRRDVLVGDNNYNANNNFQSSAEQSDFDPDKTADEIANARVAAKTQALHDKNMTMLKNLTTQLKKTDSQLAEFKSNQDNKIKLVTSPKKSVVPRRTRFEHTKQDDKATSPTTTATTERGRSRATKTRAIDNEVKTTHEVSQKGKITEIKKKQRSRSAGASRASSSVRRNSGQRLQKPTSDPVALYQYYRHEWKYFQDQIPGETSHSDLRRQIHYKLLEQD